MTLIALILGFLLERTITRVLHLRALRWLDPWFDRGRERAEASGHTRALAFLWVLLLILVPVAPVVFVWFLLQDQLIGTLEMVFAVVVLIYSLGPRDLETQVQDYLSAREAGDQDEADVLAQELLNGPVPDGLAERARQLSTAVLVQANNRVFGVVLWFALLGPIGAWSFRVLELLTLRLTSEAAGSPLSGAALAVHGVVAWLPARLLALGYALAGSFEDAVSDWKAYYRDCAGRFFEINEQVVACSGCGALAGDPDAEMVDVAQEIEHVRRAQALVMRTLIVWIVVIALLTLVGLAA